MIVMKNETSTIPAGNGRSRLATLDCLVETVLPQYLNPIPSKPTLRGWFRAARIPFYKNNLAARRGGGECYFT
jgi:hypothetical protein